MKINRRQFLQGSIGLLGTSALGRSGKVLAETGSHHNIIFITCFGGWDPTRALVSAFENPLVNMEIDAVPANINGFSFVDHPERQSVRQFFQNHSQKTACLHGILTPSVAHFACLKYMRTGFISGHPDWPSILSKELFSTSPLPHLAISGSIYPAQFSSLLAEMGGGGQLEGLLANQIANWSDIPVNTPANSLIEAERELRMRRVERVIETSNRDIFQQVKTSLLRSQELLARQSEVNWNADGSFLGDCFVAIDVLERGLGQCISIEHPSLWDSHSNNDIYQFWLWEELFAGLNILCQELEQREGRNGSLADETTIVVLSDMGRSPSLNGDDGKDHWPYSSAMFISPKVQGARHFGGYDEYFFGQGINRETGDVSENAQQMMGGDLGATILELMGVDWIDYLPTSMPLFAMLQ